MKISQLEFDNLLQKYLNGNADIREQKLIKEWYNDQNQELEDFDENQKEIIKKTIWQNIKINQSPTRLVPKPWIIASGIAASIGLFFIYMLNFYTPKQLTFTNNTQGVIIENNTAAAQTINLVDGSIVELESKSSLSYTGSFGTINREVTLKGEAFFKIYKNPKKPFIVNSGDLITQVLGTSFRIKPSSDNKKLEVDVISGSVSIYENSKNNAPLKNGLILTPNQKGIFNIQTKELTPTIVEKPLAIQYLETKLVFEDEKVKNIIHLLCLKYGLEIILVNDDIGNCLFTGDINDLTLNMQIELICKTLDAKYEQRGTDIFIFGKGC